MRKHLFTCLLIAACSGPISQGPQAPSPHRELSPVVLAPQGQTVGNGGGSAEKTLVYAFLHLHDYLSLCLSSRDCHLSGDDRELLSQIDHALPREGGAESLVFLSGRENAGFFHRDGQVRVAVTGSELGNPIYINRDLIYTVRPDGSAQAIDLPFAIAILVHELGHHHRVSDHQRLDLLGTRVQSLVQGHTEQSTLADKQRNGEPIQVVSTFFGSDDHILGNGEHSSLLLRLSGHWVDFSPELRAFVEPRCTEGRHLGYYRIWNLHWGPESFYPLSPEPGHSPQNAYVMHMLGTVLFYCGGGGAESGETRFDLSFSTALDEGPVVPNFAADDAVLKTIGVPRLRRLPDPPGEPIPGR